MNKIFPLLVATLCLAGFLTGQLVFDYLSSNANLSSQEKSQKAHFKSIFGKLKLETSSGKKLELSKVESPIVIINFWASWCVPCLEEFPSLVKMNDLFSDKEVLIIGINNDDEEDQKRQVAKIKNKYKLNFPIVLDPKNEILKKFMISAIPVTVIYIDGDVYEISNGSRDFVDKKLISHFKSYLQKKKK